MSLPDDVARKLRILLHELEQERPGMTFALDDLLDRLERLKAKLGEGRKGVTLSAAELGRLTRCSKMASAFVAAQSVGIDNFRSHYGLLGTTRQREADMLDALGVLEECTDAYRNKLAFEREVVLRTDIRGFGFIRASDSELRRAFMNLLNNAVKYTFRSRASDQERFIRVVGREWGDGGILVKVSNLGVGILPEEVELMRQAEARGQLAIANEHLGSGLGLAEVEKIAKHHRGRLEIVSRLATKDVDLARFRTMLREEPSRAKKIPWKTEVYLRLLGLAEGGTS